MLNPTDLFQLVMAFAVFCAFGGLWFGLNNRRRDLDYNATFFFAAAGYWVAIASVGAMTFGALSVIGNEIAGLMLSLAMLIGGLGVGLCIGPARRQ